MSILRINSGPLHPQPADGADLVTALHGALVTLPPKAPIVILLHGLRFSPFDSAQDPHAHIYALEPPAECWKARSWPAALGFGKGRRVGLCIPFGWDAAAWLGTGYRRAGKAGAQLGRLLDLIHELAGEGHPIHMFAHSLGARVALRALCCTNAPVDRVILQNPAEFLAPAKRALATPAGQRAQILHISAVENLGFDALFQLAAPRRRRGDIALGLRAPKTANWRRVPISDPVQLAHLRQLDLGIAPRRHALCHWSTYTRPGIFTLYKALLTDPKPLPVSALSPERPAPRASRFQPARATA